MALFDDLADTARPRSADYIAGMVEGNERGSNAAKLRRLIARVERYADILDGVPDASIVAETLRAAIEEAKR